MATLDITINGDASGAVAAATQTSQALSDLGSAGATAGAGIAAAGEGTDKAFTAIERTGSGLRALASSVGEVAPAMAAAGGASSEAAAGIGTMATALVVASTAANPLIGVLEGISMVAGYFASSSEEVGSSASKAGMSASEASAGFVTLADGTQVSAQQLIAAAAGFNAYAASGQAGASAAADAAQGLLETAASARNASEAEADAAKQAAELAASQQQVAGSTGPVIGGLNTVVEMAHNAGVAWQDMASIIGTQLPIPNAPAIPFMEPHAMGGPVTAGSPYLVGERGPELFLPSQSGSIVPNGQFDMGGGGTYIFAPNININGPSFGMTDLFAQIDAHLREASLNQTSFRGFSIGGAS